MPEESDRVGNGHAPEALPNPAAFAPANPTDNREPLDWKSKYPPEAWKRIVLEGVYLGILLLSAPALMLLLWGEAPKHWLRLTDPKYAPVLKYGLAWLGGMLGGSMFSVKWLYHSVARQIWHLDRRPWRVFTPHTSRGDWHLRS